MTITTPRLRHRAPVLVTSLLALTVAGCSQGAPTAAPSTPPPTSAAPSSSPPSPSATPTPSPTETCVQKTLDSLDEEQRVGQLLMVGFDTNAALDSLDPDISSDHIGNVIYLGGWDGAQKVTRTSKHLQGLVDDDATGGIGLMIAADQEGGEVHQLRGPGFTRPPSASEQATMSSAALTKAATGWGRGARGGRRQRQPRSRHRHGPGRHRHGERADRQVPPRVRLGPGDGREGVGGLHRGHARRRRRGDREALPGPRPDPQQHRLLRHTGITDDTTTADDPYLQPFEAGVKAGAGLVMVGSAKYTKLDPGVPAMFSHKIVTDLLRGDLGYDGVVITDDVNAKAVTSTPPAQRATKVIEAGGDIVLTGDASVAPTMASAILAKAEDDADFAGLVDASVQRVLTLKDRMGLLPCSASDDD